MSRQRLRDQSLAVFLLLEREKGCFAMSLDACMRMGIYASRLMISVLPVSVTAGEHAGRAGMWDWIHAKASGKNGRN